MNTGVCGLRTHSWNLQWYYFNICVPFPFQNKENWKCLLATTNVSALCLHFDEVSVILQALYIYARCCSGHVGRWNLIVARGMLKPVFFAFVETMLECFCKLHILLNHEHIRQVQEQNNGVDSFSTRHFDEGRPCGEPPCKLLVQRSRMLMQKDPCCEHTTSMLIEVRRTSWFWPKFKRTVHY